ncbi:MAG: helix-turn-helix domain-containing protein, partial [Acutalibacteraceae bacterium]|nr:helix-turn-helix domain-containing protein [Acutalibacteraceae bacterium]
MNVGEYIRKLRTDFGYSQEQLGSLLGVQRAAVQKWECGKVQNLKRETIKKLADTFGVSPSSFIDGDNYLNYDNIIPLPNMNKVPLLGTIACGEPILAEENVECEIDIPENINADFALRCKGDSM